MRRILQITGLEPAVYYDVRVVAENGAFLETPQLWSTRIPQVPSSYNQLYFDYRHINDEYTELH